MKLEKIEIAGFKSFRDRVTVMISDGMTCVVGPNGCGKSNVVDAIKWAMGDMSAKSLRGQSMQDVIFAGSANTKPKGMAEVTLVFANSHHSNVVVEEGEEDKIAESGLDFQDAIPREFLNVAEIAITRRLFRSGESEYLINKVPCRLLDIQNLLAGTGLGKQGYSIIEQGQVGFIVSAPPSQRRLIIEEASGITRYKTQRERAEKKLERTGQNLHRVRDVLSEITKQIRHLERQAKRAEEFLRLSEQLKALEVTTLLRRRVHSTTKAASITKQLQESKRQNHQLAGELSRWEQSLRTKRVDVHSTEKLYQESTESFYKVQTQLNLTRSTHQHAEQSAHDARLRSEKLQNESIQQLERKKTLQVELDSVHHELVHFDDTSINTQESLQSEQHVYERLLHEFETARNKRENAQHAWVSHAEEVRQQETKSQWIKQHHEEVVAREDKLRPELNGLREEIQALRGSVSRTAIDIEQARTRVKHRVEQLEHTREQYQQKKQEVDALMRQAHAAVSRRINIQTRVESLENMRQKGEGHDTVVQDVLRWASETERDDVLGPVSDYLDIRDILNRLNVDESYQSAVASFLDSHISNVVVRSRQAAREIIEMVKQEGAGRITCYVLPTPESDPGAEVARWLDALHMVESIDAIPDIVEASHTWATNAGELVYSDGRIIGGAAVERSEELLKQARVLKSMREELREVKKAEQQSQEELALANEELLHVEGQVQALQQQYNEARQLEHSLVQTQISEEKQLERTLSHEKRLAAELESIGQSRKKQEQELEALESARTRSSQREATIKGTLEDCNRRVSQLQNELDSQRERVTMQQVAIAQGKERKRALQASAERLANELQYCVNQIERMNSEADELQKRSVQLQSESAESAGKLKSYEIKLREAQQTQESLKSALQRAVNETKDLEMQVVKRRRALEANEKAYQQLEMTMRETQLSVAHIDEQLRERFSLTLENARAMVDTTDDAPFEDLQPQIQKIKQRLEAIGNVNPMAVEEFEEARERHNFLETQKDDLESAIADLRKAIARMDQESRRRFRETFEAVDAKFQEVFPKLFRGGKARLIMTAPDDLLNTGVDIEVQPPGKRLQNVNLLSGGEKALTAVSLIFSIFMLKPTPFCVLDEVDAPLDEANVGRFAQMVRELSETSQMLVITHQRRTMENAEVLYGVTMQEPGVSKVVSVRLTEVHETIAS